MKVVRHTPVWVPADLPVDAEGNTRNGYVCIHKLENGNGECGGNVFSVNQAIGDHSCAVDDEQAEVSGDETLTCGAYAPGFLIRCGAPAVATVQASGRMVGVCAEQVKDAREAGYVVTMIEEATR